MLSYDEWVTQVGSAYEYLYDIVHLRTHPLVEALVKEPDLGAKERAWKLHQILLDAIEELDPGREVPPNSYEWRRYRLLVLRYLEGLDPQAVADRLAISRRTFYRYHHDAMEALTTILKPESAHHPADQPVAEKDGPAPSEAGSDLPDRLALLRFEAARMAQSEDSAQLASVLGDVLDLLRGTTKERGIRIEIEESLPAPVEVDRSLFRQILLGGLGYLLERLESGEIVISLRRQGTQALMTMRCRGSMRQDVPRNSGGYCIRSLKELATVAGVDFSPLSPHDAASGFTLSIPIQDARTVLVVDDNEDTLMLMQRYLEQNGYHILLARSSAEALDLARGHRPHVIMLDLMMPDRDGWDTLQILTNQSETRHIPVIVCTVLSAADLALALGASAYLEKPVTEQSLLDVLSALEAA